MINVITSSKSSFLDAVIDLFNGVSNLSPMAIHSKARLLACTVLSSLCFTFLTNAQTCYNSSTAINGKPFPPLIEATTEDLITGLESGLFTSVDLVNVRWASSQVRHNILMGYRHTRRG